MHRDGRYSPAIIIRQTFLPVTSPGMGDTHQLLHIRQTLLAVISPGMGDSALLLLHDRFYSMLFPHKQFSKIIARKGRNILCLINCIIIYSHIHYPKNNLNIRLKPSLSYNFLTQHCSFMVL